MFRVKKNINERIVNSLVAFPLQMNEIFEHTVKLLYRLVYKTYSSGRKATLLWKLRAMH